MDQDDTVNSPNKRSRLNSLASQSLSVSSSPSSTVTDNYFVPVSHGTEKVFCVLKKKIIDMHCGIFYTSLLGIYRIFWIMNFSFISEMQYGHEILIIR